MSRIYDALKYSEAGRSAALLQLIDGEHVHASEDVQDETTPESDGEASGPSVVGAPEEPVAAPESPVGASSAPPPESSQPSRSVTAVTAPRSPVFPFGGSDQRAAEQYRILRTNIVQHELAPRIIAVTSAVPGDGKTVTAVNIAFILALKGDARVLLVDADLRQRTLAKTIGIPSAPGLTDVIQGDTPLMDAVVRLTQLPGLFVLPSGTLSGNPSELLDSPVFRTTVDSLREQFSYVVLDTTPMTAVADFKLVQQVCDGVLVVVRPDHTNRAAFTKAMQGQQKEKFLGTVINAIEDWFLWNSNDHYKYYSGHPSKGRPPRGGLVVRYKSKN